MSRIAPAAGRGRWSRRSAPSSALPTVRRAWCRCSHCSTPRRHKFMPTSTAPRPRCWACRSRASSTRCRPTWARPSSTTSTSWGGPTGSMRRPTIHSGSHCATSRTCAPARTPATWCRWARSPPFSEITGPYRVPRYNLFPAAEVQGATLPGFSTGPGDRRHGATRGRQFAGRFRL